MAANSIQLSSQRFFFFGTIAPKWARASSFTRFRDHTQRHTTVGRTTLDEGSARRRDLPRDWNREISHWMMNDEWSCYQYNLLLQGTAFIPWTLECKMLRLNLGLRERKWQDQENCIMRGFKNYRCLPRIFYWCGCGSGRVAVSNFWGEFKKEICYKNLVINVANLRHEQKCNITYSYLRISQPTAN